MENEEKTKSEIYTKEYDEYLFSLFQRASNTSGFEYLCTIIRVHGITNGHWDTFVEAEEAANDISEIMRELNSETEKKKALRLGLFLYCHLTEMSAPYEILMNLIRCIKSERYHIQPFHHLVKTTKNGTRIFPSPFSKIKELETATISINENKLTEIINGFFNKNIRNAFYHSDYAITEDEFRIIEGSKYGAEVHSLETISDMLARCFGFYSAFFSAYKRAKKYFSHTRTYHRWPNYEVLEILKENDDLLGFKLHFPNGGHAMFSRKPYEGTMGLNIMFEENGLTYNVGLLDSYRNASDWMVDGKKFIEHGTRYNPYGYWRPIIFSRSADTIQKKMVELTQDHDLQGLVFYVLATGHIAIEFVITSKQNLFESDNYLKNVDDKKSIEIIKFQSDENTFIYDGTVFLNSESLEDISKGFSLMNKTIEEMKIKDPELRHTLKYQIYRSSKPKVAEDGSFYISLEMDDPRSIMVASNLQMFPKSDWKIKAEWVD